jgi:diketogulonate reductase-like aldo/keto reductase
MRQFFAAGGKMIDSSPMYGSAQDVIGYCLQKLNMHEKVFSTDKVWTFDGSEGRHQIARSQKRWGIPRFDLLQVHNILSWEDHLPTLQEMKTSGKVRYVGITTSHGRRHREFEKIMQSQSLDFIQLTYNMRDREAENRLLPLAKELGIAVIINRPFQRGSLIDWAKKHPLPGWAKDIDCSNWAQFLLKFIISHPAVTCAIPATSRVDHLMENMGAASGRLPDAAMRQEMLAYVESL